MSKRVISDGYDRSVDCPDRSVTDRCDFRHFAA